MNDHGDGDVFNEQTKSILGFGSCGELWDEDEAKASGTISPESRRTLSIRNRKQRLKEAAKKSAMSQSTRNEERI
jgi:hypothetical protein